MGVPNDCVYRGINLFKKSEDLMRIKGQVYMLRASLNKISSNMLPLKPSSFSKCMP